MARGGAGAAAAGGRGPPRQGGAAAAHGPDGEVGAKLGRVLRARARKQPLEDSELCEQAALALLEALREAYSERGLQAEIRELHQSLGGDDLKFITALGPLAARAQAPVFERFGLPPGSRGVMHMKMAVKAISESSPAVRELAGDLRELLGLRREEELDTAALLRTAESGLLDLAGKLARAPLDVRGQLAEALKLPYKASPLEIAKEVPKIRDRAQEIAELHMQKGRSEVIGVGKVLGPNVDGDVSDAELRCKLVDAFEHYLQKMVSRVVTPIESYTCDPDKFRCAWADSFVESRHVEELWGRPQCGGAVPGNEWLRLGVGVTVADGAAEAELVQRARVELDKLEAGGEVQDSKDPCNVGARSVWLHFETPEEHRALPPALRELCDRLTGLPAALMARAAGCPALREAGQVPRLRVHPHVMAATYRRGAEYHCHKDSYGGTDNQRMISVLLYLNHEWRPGDAGELRIFAGDPKEAEGSAVAHADIAPLCGRLVIFRSREVWHAVREPREQRWALTLWVMAD